MTRLDPRKPLVLSTRELNRRPGSMQEVRRTVVAPELLGTDIIAIPAGAPLELEIRLESVVEGVLVSGSVRATATGACVRCLEPATYAVDASFQELFAYPDRAAHHHEVGADSDMTRGAEVHELVGEMVDLEPVLRDAVVPSLPFQPVCREDCPGLCSECGALLAQDPDHQHDSVDPRWASLSGLLAVAGSNEHDDDNENDDNASVRTTGEKRI